ncbi:MAG: hypothetical protein U0694_04395 [Anaerolineae bacterium]
MLLVMGTDGFSGKAIFVGVLHNTATYGTSVTDISLLFNGFLPFDQFYFRSQWQGSAAWRYAELNPDFIPC